LIESNKSNQYCEYQRINLVFKTKASVNECRRSDWEAYHRHDGMDAKCHIEILLKVKFYENY